MTIDLNSSEPVISKAGTQKPTTALNYKSKQDSIIEMIQSNMQRSDNIQQSLSSGRFFSSVQKTSESRKSVSSALSA